jgi:glycerol-1-phosphate dehydrogenase [NAD(P)+]
MIPSTSLPAERLRLEDALESARETRALVVRSGALSEVAQVFAEQFPGRKAVVIADERTTRVAGAAVAESLRGHGMEGREPFVFRDPDLYAEFRFVEDLDGFLREHDAIPIAVGSGTINDLTKLSAHRTGRAGYMCVATAASMDGYTAFGASITFQGAKQTFECPAPRAVVADLEVIRNAPPEMTASGYADLAAKITAGADWILADALGVEPIEPRAWSIVQGSLRDSLSDPAGARAGEARAIGPLVKGLMLGGFAMQWSKSSRPASGAEHQFSHLWDMEHHIHQGAAPSHGFKVGVATLAITRLYEALLDLDLSSLDVDACVAAWPDVAAAEAEVVRKFGGADFLDTAVKETRAKHAAADEIRAQLEQMKDSWPEIRARLVAQLMPSPELKRRLELAGAPSEPEQIGISRARLRETFGRAYYIRRRFTVLDLARRVGVFEPIPDRLFGPGGAYPVAPAAGE